MTQKKHKPSVTAEESPVVAPEAVETHAELPETIAMTAPSLIAMLAGAVNDLSTTGNAAAVHQLSQVEIAAGVLVQHLPVAIGVAGEPLKSRLVDLLGALS